MIDYRAGVWGFHVAWGWRGSLAPRAFAMALPNAIITFLVATWLNSSNDESIKHEDTIDAAQKVMAVCTAVMLFILHNRSRVSYNRWWEGGTLLQKTRGEWFNAYSSIMAFTSTKPEHQAQVESYTHLLARLMSLLMCCGLQQVSPHRDRPFEIIDLDGIESESMEFLNSAPDKVEIILQWIQRSMVLHVQTGVLPVAPPILSRAFQEVSRGIVNLQNARKIADFPYPFPLAQVSMILQILHWAMTPIASALAVPRGFAVLLAFSSIFVLWCIHFNALDLEFPFGTRVNDLPMLEMQQDWNNSVCTLLMKRAQRPPTFSYDPLVHRELSMAMSDASELYAPKVLNARTDNRRSVASIRISGKGKKDPKELQALAGSANVVGNAQPLGASSLQPGGDVPPAGAVPPAAAGTTQPSKAASQPETANAPSSASGSPPAAELRVPVVRIEAPGTGGAGLSTGALANVPEPSSKSEPQATPQGGKKNVEEKLDEKSQNQLADRNVVWEKQLAEVSNRMKELHNCLIDEEIRLMASLTRAVVEPKVAL